MRADGSPSKLAVDPRRMLAKVSGERHFISNVPFGERRLGRVWRAENALRHPLERC